MAQGQTVLLNQFPHLGVSKCGSQLCGLYSAEYSLNRSIKSIFAPNNSSPIAKFGEIPNITLSYSQYLDSAGAHDASEFNTVSKIELKNRSGSAVCDLALLTRITYSFTIDGPFLVTKTYIGYSKAAAGSGSSTCGGPRRVFMRKDYSGSSPPGINSTLLTAVTVDITVNRENVPEFATHKPYASTVSFPMTTSIKYDFLTEGVDTYVLDAFSQACGDPDTTKYSLSASACGITIPVNSAFITDLSYSGGEASQSSKPQTGSVTFTSYETISGLKPVIKFSDISSC